MRSASAKYVLLGLVAAWSFPGRAEAEQWYTGARSEGGQDWIVASDSSVTATSTGSVFGAATLTGAVADTLRYSGFRVRAEGIAGRYEYDRTGGGHVTGRQAEGSLLAGYEWIQNRTAVAAYLGLVARDNRISLPDPTNPAVGTALGVKVALETYAEPTDRTMVSGHGSYASAFNAYYGRVKLGYDIGGRVFVGPEAAALGDDFYRQWRVGLHATGLQIGPMQFALAGGLLSDRRQGLGAYATVDARAGF